MRGLRVCEWVQLTARFPKFAWWRMQLADPADRSYLRVRFATSALAPQCNISRQVPPILNLQAAATAAAATPTSVPTLAALASPSVAAAVRQALHHVSDGQLAAAVAAIAAAVAAEEAAAAAPAARGGQPSGTAPLPPLTVAAVVYGELLEAAGYRPPEPAPPQPSDAEGSAAEGESGGGNSSSGGEAEQGNDLVAAVEKLARYQLGQRARAAPVDSLGAAAALLRHVLPGGGRHVVCRTVEQLVEANMSMGARQQMMVGDGQGLGKRVACLGYRTGGGFRYGELWGAALLTWLGACCPPNVRQATLPVTDSTGLPVVVTHMQIRRQRAQLEAQAAAVLQQQRGTGGALVVGPGGAADARWECTRGFPLTSFLRAVQE